MLGKLIKYEFKATSGFMMLMYSVLIAVSAVMSVALKLNLDETIDKISESFPVGWLIYALLSFVVVCVFIIMNVAVICGMYFYSIVRFKNDLLGDQGYLMHTLPVKTRDNIFAKNIVSIIWTIFSIVVVIIAYFVLFLGACDATAFRELGEIVQLIAENIEFGYEFAVLLFEIVIWGIINISNQYFHIYTSMAIGYSSNTSQMAKSIGIYILINIFVKIVHSFVYGMLINLLSLWELTFFAGSSLFLGIDIVFMTVITTIYYSITNHYLSHKLNLQ